MCPRDFEKQNLFSFIKSWLDAIVTVRFFAFKECYMTFRELGIINVYTHIYKKRDRITFVKNRNFHGEGGGGLNNMTSPPRRRMQRTAHDIFFSCLELCHCIVLWTSELIIQRLVYNLFFYGRIVLSPYTWIIHIRMKQHFFLTGSSCQKSRYHARVDQLQWNRICPSAIYFLTPHSRSYFALWVHTTCKWTGIVLLAIHIGMAGIVLDAT